MAAAGEIGHVFYHLQVKKKCEVIKNQIGRDAIGHNAIIPYCNFGHHGERENEKKVSLAR